MPAATKSTAKRATATKSTAKRAMAGATKPGDFLLIDSVKAGFLPS